MTVTLPHRHTRLSRHVTHPPEGCDGVTECDGESVTKNGDREEKAEAEKSSLESSLSEPRQPRNPKLVLLSLSETDREAIQSRVDLLLRTQGEASPEDRALVERRVIEVAREESQESGGTALRSSLSASRSLNPRNPRRKHPRSRM